MRFKREIEGDSMRVTTMLAATGLLLGTAAHAQNAPAGSAERGQKIFMHQLCQACHGTVGQGGERGAGPKIAPNPFPWVAFEQQVRKPRQVMLPYSAKNLPDQDLADIYAYLVSIKTGPLAKDVPLLSGF
jgi:mono/diheme cytochrome c family protein